MIKFMTKQYIKALEVNRLDTIYQFDKKNLM